MSTRALVFLGRIYNGDKIPPGQKRYDAGGLKLAPWVESVPLIIDHDPARRVGTVERLDTFDDAATGRWATASCTLYPDAPAWIKKGVGASMGSKLTHESSFVAGWLHGGYVEEVTVCRDMVPREPLAKVALIYEKPDPEPALPAGYARGYEELWRRVDAGERIEDVIRSMQERELRKQARNSGRLVRHGIGSIVGVS